jgi:hypothetical protein
MTAPLSSPGEWPPDGQMLIYRDGSTQLQVRLDGQTVWLSQRLIADLFQVTVPNVSQHLKAIYEEGELQAEATVKQYLIVQTEGSRQVSRLVDHYNLDAIIAVGYRVRSPRGTQFRQWATARLAELLAKGFTLDDERIKAGRTLGDDYFDELLARIRDIRSSERMFYQKITDIYATSIDYDPDVELTKTFFQTVQNKMHWAAHGHTAAEVVRLRADATKPQMGLTSWKNAPVGPIRKADVAIAKNYLHEEELKTLNLIVSAYLDFAELQAGNRRPMHMSDWIGKLDDFLTLSEREVLHDAGRIAHKAAEQHAHGEFARFDAERRRLEATQPTSDFDTVVDEVNRLTNKRRALPKKEAGKKPTKKKRPPAGEGDMPK